MPRGIPNTKTDDSQIKEIGDPEVSNATSSAPEPEKEAAPTQDRTPAMEIDPGVKRPWMSGEKVEITVFSGETDQSKLPVEVSVNDYTCRFPRDKAVVLPKEAADVIVGAVYDNLVRDAGGNVVNRPIRRFQYAISRVISA